MNLNFIFTAFFFFLSTTNYAQNLKMDSSLFFPNALIAGRDFLKTFSEGVLKKQNIEKEAKRRDFGIADLFGYKKPYSEMMKERRKSIKSARQEMIESNRNLQLVGAKSSQELENEFLSLLALGSLSEEEESSSLTIEAQEDKNLLLPQKSDQSQTQSWKVPGMLVAPISGCSSSESGSATLSEATGGVTQSALSLPAESLLPPLHGSVLWQYSPYGMTRREVIPQGLGVKDRIIIINYNFENPVPIARLQYDLAPDLKFGGVLMDLPPSTIAALLKFITGVELCSIDMFLKNQGRCSVSLYNKDVEAPHMIQLLHKRLWLGPVHALYALSEESSDFLSEYAKNVRQAIHSDDKFPRHLVTVEYWIKRKRAPLKSRIRNYEQDFGSHCDSVSNNQQLTDSDKNVDEEIRHSEHIAITNAMRVNPLERAPAWYKGSRKVSKVGDLEWELGRKHSNEMDFIEAQAYAETRSTEGWRLPTIIELEALYQQKSLLGDDLHTGWFWSSTAVVGCNVDRWGINFEKGFVYCNDDYHDVRVRLVRG